MKLEDQVCSLDLAKRLKELGVKQKSLFFWRETGAGYSELVDVHGIAGDIPSVHYYPAFTVAELGELLPQYAASYKDRNDWCIDNAEIQKERVISFHADTEVDARAKMVIYLLENKLLTSQE